MVKIYFTDDVCLNLPFADCSIQMFPTGPNGLSGQSTDVKDG